jgi:hypothetical protein
MSSAPQPGRTGMDDPRAAAGPICPVQRMLFMRHAPIHMPWVGARPCMRIPRVFDPHSGHDVIQAMAGPDRAHLAALVAGNGG